MYNFYTSRIPSTLVNRKTRICSSINLYNLKLKQKGGVLEIIAWAYNFTLNLHAFHGICCCLQSLSHFWQTPIFFFFFFFLRLHLFFPPSHLLLLLLFLNFFVLINIKVVSSIVVNNFLILVKCFFQIDGRINQNIDLIKKNLKFKIF